jgi:hypothetical protein
MSIFPARSAPAHGLAPVWSEACIAVVLDDHRFLLDDGRLARQALSCLVLPQVGDRVLVSSSAGAEAYVVHVLSRNNLHAARLAVPGAAELHIEQESVALHAEGTIALHCLRDVEIAAATGVLTLNANNLFSTVNESKVESVRHYVGKAEHYLLDAGQLLRLQGRQAMLLAEQDVKIDSDRISVG